MFMQVDELPEVDLLARRVRQERDRRGLPPVEGSRHVGLSEERY
jgi:hypothetical protein